MTVLSADSKRARKEGDVVAVPVAATTDIFMGSLVMNLSSAGEATPAADTANGQFLGIALERADNNPGAAEAIDVKVQTRGVYEIATTETATIDDVGKLVYVVDDNTVAFVGTTTNDVLVGRIVEFISANLVAVKLITIFDTDQ